MDGHDNGKEDQERHSLYPRVMVTSATSYDGSECDANLDGVPVGVEAESSNMHDRIALPSSQLKKVTRAQNRIIEFQEANCSKEALRKAVNVMADELDKLKNECQRTDVGGAQQCAAKEAWMTKNIGAKEEFLRGVIRDLAAKTSSSVSTTSSKRAAARRAALALERQQLEERQRLQLEHEQAQLRAELQAREEEQRRELLLLRQRKENELQLRLRKERDELECRIEQARVLDEEDEIPDVQLDARLPDFRSQGSAPFEVPHICDGPRGATLDDGRVENWVQRGEGSATRPVGQATELLLQQALLPPTKLPVFDGDCLQFNMFMRNFEVRVEQVTSDPAHRLQLLLQHLKGDPYTLVCASQLANNAQEGYERAKKRLMREYGHPVRQTIAYRNKLFEWPPIKRDAAQELKRFRLQLELCADVKNSGVGLNELDSPATILMLVRKLPERMQEAWTRKVCNIEDEDDREADFEDFVKFVRRSSDAYSHPVYGKFSKPDLLGQVPVKGSKALAAVTETGQIVDDQCKDADAHCAATAASSREPGQPKASTPDVWAPPCVFCDGEHRTVDCTKASQLDLHERRKRLQGLCFGCLKPGHMARRCRQRSTCSICHYKHPTVLHDSANELEDQNETEKKEANCATNAARPGPGIAVTMVPVRVWARTKGEYVVVKAVLDSASTATFMTAGLLEKLGVAADQTSLKIASMSNPQGGDTVARVAHGLQVADLDGNNGLLLPPVYVVDAMPFGSEAHGPPDVDRWPHLQALPIPRVAAPVGLLFGMNAPDAVKTLQVVDGGEGEPYASRSRFGWSVNGPLDPEMPGRGAAPQTAATTTAAGRSLEQQLDAMYYYDFKGAFDFTTKGPSQEDLRWLQLVRQSIRRTAEGRYEVALPFRGAHDREALTNNKQQALQRLRSLERRFTRDARFRDDYVQFMQKMEDNGYVEEVVENADGAVGAFYIPHHGVYHPRKPGKIRVVFNCANRFKGLALNDCLLQGPDLTNSLLGVLLRFRQELVAFMADIESMFYRVLVPTEDRDHLRYLWWPGGVVGDENIRVYRMKVHLFGATSSPSVANFALRKAAKDAVAAGEASETAETAIATNFYVDDCLRSAASVEEATRLAHDLIRACSYGGFRLTKFISSSAHLLQSLPGSELSKGLAEIDLQDKNDPLGGLQERALGVMWCIREDVFKFKIDAGARAKQPVTKRSMLSALSAVYDPLGFAAPVTIVARVCFRNIAREQDIQWDDQIQSHKWNEWIEGLTELERVVVPRCFGGADAGHWELHLFCDASAEAYAAVAYARKAADNPSEEALISFVMGKARVTPPKVVTIPRLELTAAKLATEVAAIISRELQYRFVRRVFWTDSQTVIKYLNNKERRFHTFVANRVGSILNTTKASEWRHVPTSLNPADEATRGLDARNLGAAQWLNGPSFLCEPEGCWPSQMHQKQLQVPETDPEVKHAVRSAASRVLEEVITPIDIMAQHYSTLSRFLNAVAIWKRFLRFIDRKRSKQDQGHQITAEELRQAELTAIRAVQQRAWPVEISALRAGEHVCKGSGLFGLSPMLEDDVVIMRSRVGKVLPILPRGRLAELMVKAAHADRAHMGRQATMAEAQRRVWILGLGRVARKLVRQCAICQRLKARPAHQEMAPLPTPRLRSKHAFETTGVDYFGPFLVKTPGQEKASRMKMYGVVFTCAASRAVHLEAAESLSSSSFLNALRRFIARRGHVKQFLSDNGTNLSGAVGELDKELRKEIKRLRLGQSVDVQAELRRQGIDWQFNTPAAPHRGGIWERLIGIVKQCLRALVQHVMTAEVLTTVLCEVECIVNNRPLTTVSEDSNDLEALTPNHILLGREGAGLLPGRYRADSESGPPNLRKQWRHAQARVRHFWSRWTKDYKALLHKRDKWSTEQKKLQVNDVVLVLDPLEMRQYWKLGRIVNALPAQDHQTRTYEVATAKGTLIRPITKLCLLETASNRTP